MSALDRAIDRLGRSYEAIGGDADGGVVVESDDQVRLVAVHTGVPSDELQRALIDSAVSDVLGQVVELKITLDQGLRGLVLTAFLLGYFAKEEQG